MRHSVKSCQKKSHFNVKEGVVGSILGQICVTSFMNAPKGQHSTVKTRPILGQKGFFRTGRILEKMYYHLKTKLNLK